MTGEIRFTDTEESVLRRAVQIQGLSVHAFIREAAMALAVKTIRIESGDEALQGSAGAA